MDTEIELGTINYSDVTVHAFAVDPSALTNGEPHQVIQANDTALYVLFDDHVLRESVNDELARGVAPQAVQRSVLEVADYFARRFVRQS